MAAKSIIEIDVQDDKFKAFKSLYDDYQTALGEVPDKWKEANDEMGQAVKVSELLRNDAQTRLALLQEETIEQQKKDSLAKKEEDKQKKALNDRKKSDEDTKKRWLALGNIIKDTTLGLVKFATVSAGLATGAGAFGMGKLANDASQTRFSSMGLGISSGAMQSANLNYAKLLGSPTQSLSAIRESQTDVSQSWKFSALGIHGQEGKQSSELLPEVLTKIRDTLKAAPTSQRENIAKAYGMDSFTSAEDRQRMVAMSDAEFTAENKRYQNDIKLLAVSDSTLKSYQDLNTQWDRFKQQAENTFMKGLEPLAPALTRFSESVTTAFSKLMLSDKLEPMINKLADGITRFSAYLTSPEAEKDFDKFVTFIKLAAESLGAFAAFIGTITPEKALAAGAVGVGGMALAGAAGSALVGGAALPLAGAVAGGAMLGSSVYNNDTIENQQWTQDIVGGLAAFFGDKDAIEAQKAQTNFKNLSSDIGKPMSADEYKKADDDSRSSFIKGIGGEFKTALSDLWEKTKEVAGDAAGGIIGAANASEITSTDTTAGMKGGDKAKYAMSKFMEMGWTKEQAAGLAANLHRESGFKADIVGDGGKAYGIGQWHPDRQKNFSMVFGKDIRGSSLDDQLKFVDWEMRNTEKVAGDRLRGATNAMQAGGIVSKYYERPRDTEKEMRERGNLANGLAGSNISYSDYKGTPFVTKKDASGKLITVKKDYQQQPQSQSVMFQKQQGGYDMQQGRGMKLEINNATGGNTILSAVAL